MQGKCPFHREQHGKALTIWPEEGRWRCFGKCDRGGDVIAAVMLLHGLDFHASCQFLASGNVWHAAPTALKRTNSKNAPSLVLTPDQVRQQDKACRALRDHPQRIQAFASKRGWCRETVRGLALDGHLGLHRGNWAFIYNHGLKYRWVQKGERRIAWEFGGNRELWREDRLWPKDVRTAYICEGETDAISLIDAGLETNSATVVVAMPCAGAWQSSWNAHFRERDVVILTDADSAGDRAAATITRELHECASRIVRLRVSDLAPASKPTIAS